MNLPESTAQNKIRPLEDIFQVLEQPRRAGGKGARCQGVFDLACTSHSIMSVLDLPAFLQEIKRFSQRYQGKFLAV